MLVGSAWVWLGNSELLVVDASGFPGLGGQVVLEPCRVEDIMRHLRVTLGWFLGGRTEIPATRCRGVPTCLSPRQKPSLPSSRVSKFKTPCCLPVNLYACSMA